jgi:hypothetical protein
MTYINIKFKTKDFSTKTEMEFESNSSTLKVESGDIPRFDAQITFHNTARDLSREIQADLESILARVPRGYKVTIYADGGKLENDILKEAGVIISGTTGEVI